MGKGKSLKELSVEFKKLKAEGKLDDEGNVVEASNLTRNGLNKKKKKKRKDKYTPDDWMEDLETRKKMLKLHDEIEKLHRQLNTTYSMSKLVELLKKHEYLNDDENGDAHDGDAVVATKRHIEQDSKRNKSNDDGDGSIKKRESGPAAGTNENWHKY
jgi:hypothetical protein